MRAFTALFVASSLISAPAFAQAVVKDGGQAAPNNSLAASKNTAIVAAPKAQRGLSLGHIDQFSINRTADRPIPGLAPVEKDQLDLAWRPGGKWGITFDFTTRSPNEALLPREELQAGAYYQVTPRFRFGGGLTLKGDSLPPSETGKSEPPDAGVRISSAFSF